MMAPAAINAAVNDALAPLGVRLTELPMTPERILCAPCGQPGRRDERRRSRWSPAPTGASAGPSRWRSPPRVTRCGQRPRPGQPGRHGRGGDGGTAGGDGGLPLAVRRPGRGVRGGAGRRGGGSSGPVHAVVANAGVAGPTAPLHEITLEEWRDTLATDLDGVFLTFRAFIPGLIARRRGSLIAISSMTGKRPLHGRTPYAAAKMGVIGLVRTLATELGPHGIRVNAVCPGYVAGPRMDEVVRRQAAVRGITEEQARAEVTSGSPLGRMVQAEEVAAACVVPRLRRLGRDHRRGPQRHRRRGHVLIPGKETHEDRRPVAGHLRGHEGLPRAT